MSQQQINRISAEKYLEKAQETLKKQADLFYLEEHFKIDSKYDRDKFIHAQLYKDILCTDDCEILNWVDRKIRGKLDGKVKLSKDKKILPNTPDIIVNNYYTLNNEWQETIDW
jgi:hypothetical protein